MMEKSSSQHHLSPYIFDVPQTSSKICLPCLGRRGAVRGAGPGGVAGSRVSSTAVSFRLFCDVYLSSRSLPPGPCVSICHTYTVLIDDRRHSRQRERARAYSAASHTHTHVSDRQTDTKFQRISFSVYDIQCLARLYRQHRAHAAQCLSLVRVRRMLSPRGTVSLYLFILCGPSDPRARERGVTSRRAPR